MCSLISAPSLAVEESSALSFSDFKVHSSVSEKLSDVKSSSPALLLSCCADPAGCGGRRRAQAGPDRAGLLGCRPPTERPGRVGVIYGPIDPSQDKKSPCCCARAAAAGRESSEPAAENSTALLLLLLQYYYCDPTAGDNLSTIAAI